MHHGVHVRLRLEETFYHCKGHVQLTLSFTHSYKSLLFGRLIWKSNLTYVIIKKNIYSTTIVTVCLRSLVYHEGVLNIP